jgi:hypothetical protein
LRAHSSRTSHTSSPVRVPRPAPSFHAASRPHLTVTPWRFPGPSAPRIPGQGTCTPKHDRMHGTHACGEPPPEAEARHERTLEGVGSRPGLGWGHSDRLPRGCPPPRDAVTLVVLPEAPATLLHQCPAPAYLITSSAWKRSVGGMVSPSASAVLRLMISSNFTGCSTGRFPGLAPLRILST